MNNVLHQKKWNMGVLEVYIEPPLIPLMKSKQDDKWDKYFVKMKLCRDPKSEKSDLCVF